MNAKLKEPTNASGREKEIWARSGELTTAGTCFHRAKARFVEPDERALIQTESLEHISL